MECRMCTVEDWRTLIAADRGIDLGAYRKRAGSLHDAKFRLFVAEVTRCEQSFGGSSCGTATRAFRTTEPVQSKPEDGILCTKSDRSVSHRESESVGGELVEMLG